MGIRAEQLLEELNDSRNGIISISTEDILSAIEVESYQKGKVRTKNNQWYLVITQK
jgi:hypothetical protein